MYKKIKNLAAWAVILLLTACEAPKPPVKEVLPTPVTAALPAVKDISLYLHAVGVLEASYYIDLRPQVSGPIERIFVQEGAWVKTGDPLFKIDSRPYEISVKEAKAQLLMDQAAYDAAQKKRERFYSLAQKDLVAQVEWDEIEMMAAKAKAILDSDHAKVEAALLQLERCTICAPSEGRIGHYDIHPGTLVSSEQVLTTLSRNDPLIVNFSLTEKDFAKLNQRENLAFEVNLLCGIDCMHQGNITFLNNRFDEKSGMIFIRGELQNDAESLRPGQSVSVRIPISTQTEQTVVSQKAIKYNQQGPYAYVISADQTLEFRQLILGEEVGKEEIAVLEGISPHEPVITSSHGRLSPGLKVEVQP